MKSSRSSCGRLSGKSLLFLNAKPRLYIYGKTEKLFLLFFLRSPYLGMAELGELLEICNLLYEPQTSHLVVFRLPRYWKAQHIGKVRLEFFFLLLSLPRSAPYVSAYASTHIICSSVACLSWERHSSQKQHSLLLL
jgi:hypothetical protein